MMPRGGTSGDLRSLPEIESDIYWANLKDLVEEMVEAKRNSAK